MGHGSIDRSQARHHVDAQEDHPLVGGDDPAASAADIALGLIHRKAYADAAAMADGCAVLDVGCNDGYGTVLLAEHASRTAGVDVSPAAIEAARARREAAGIDFRLGDGLHLDFPDAMFDLVTAFQVIEHIDDVDAFLGELRRVMAPGATLVLTTPNAAIRLDPGMPPWNPFHVREYTAPELRTMLARRFPSVLVRGLFAPPPITTIELGRATRARDRARNPRPAAVRWVIQRLPVGARRRLRRVVGRDGSADVEAIRAYGVDDLWYADTDLELALDLHAKAQV